ncbi:hypothetical protein RHSIM_Rhsim06G0202300 [Rhododendron simsii]|uniref:Uncharacterized protein n=1 Tax=Rhododendron simsii TaxID=118357 RepID=A0A834GQW8_RHOSS|nr:hypothetical protein RHSIM_Rhsim06G0202300 [Rhododendron simsii]
MDQHDDMEVNNAQIQSEVELLDAIQHDQLEINNQWLEPALERAAAVEIPIANNMHQHDAMEVNNAQVQSKVELLDAVQHDELQINNQQLEAGPEPESSVTVGLIETYEHLKIEIIDLFQMLKVTRSSSEHLALALQLNPSLQLLRQFDQQVEEQINANTQKELEEFQRNIIWNEFAIDEIAIPWVVD